jgi:hypothetical protein
MLNSLILDSFQLGLSAVFLISYNYLELLELFNSKVTSDLCKKMDIAYKIRNEYYAFHDP